MTASGSTPSPGRIRPCGYVHAHAAHNYAETTTGYVRCLGVPLPSAPGGVTASGSTDGPANTAGKDVLRDLVAAIEAVGDDRRYWPRDMRLDGTHRAVEAALDAADAVLAAPDFEGRDKAAAAQSRPQSPAPSGDTSTGCDYCGQVQGHSPRCGNPAVISNHVHGIEMGDPPGGDTETPGHHHGPRGLAECPTCSPPPGGDDDTETLRATCTCYPGGFSPETYEGPQEWCEVHGEWRERLIAQRDEARTVAASLSARLDTATAENERLRAELARRL